MKARQQFLGRYLPRRGWLHAVAPGWKVLGVLLVGATVLVSRDLLVGTLTCLGLFALACTARIPPLELFAALRRVLILVIVIVAAQMYWQDVWVGVRVATTIVACVLASSLLTLTTRLDQLLDVFERVLQPLLWFGGSPYRCSLTALLMVRSLPVLMDLSLTARQAAYARGLDWSIRARLLPVILSAVAYAFSIAKALNARGLAEDPDD